MTRTLVLFACLLVASGCRPSADRVDADQARGSVTTDISGVPGSGSTAQRNGRPVKHGAEKVTAETLPESHAVVADVAPPKLAAERPSDESSAPDDAIELATNTAVVAPPAVPPVRIPAEYRGRWGMVPADCTSTAGDAKGLMIVGASQLRFYEATATLHEILPVEPGRFSGVFDATGEGQSWQTITSLLRQGNTLTRTEGERGFTYTRCP